MTALPPAARPSTCCRKSEAERRLSCLGAGFPRPNFRRFDWRRFRRFGSIGLFLRQSERAQLYDPSIHRRPFALDHLLDLIIALVRCSKMLLSAIARSRALCR
jgi:hypothetical protein